MSKLKKLRYALSSFVNEDEHNVGRFFRGLNEHHSRIEVQHRLMKLLQADIAVINLWTEYRYKGYVYLKKSQRHKLYKNLQLIAQDFERYRAEHEITNEQLLEQIANMGIAARPEVARAKLLMAMMAYFAPTRGAYEYLASSSFGRLLRDPAQEKLVGDCNQIVTLYIYLYSRYFDLSDLSIRLFPEHVALHFQGIDIEATTGSFANYTGKKDAQLLPIEEIVSVNLLDTTDEHFAKYEVAPKEFLQASRFAYILSHDREIVTRNLEVAYNKLVSAAMQRKDYRAALKLAKQSRDTTLISIVGQNGAIYYMENHEFAKSRQFAEYALKRADLVRDSYRAEGMYHYDAHRYHEAVKAFSTYGDSNLIAHCFEALFFAEQNKLGKNLTTETIKHHSSTVRNMHEYAKKSQNKKLIEYVDSLKKYL